MAEDAATPIQRRLIDNEACRLSVASLCFLLLIVIASKPS
jgi:hypothetical protein